MATNGTSYGTTDLNKTGKKNRLGGKATTTNLINAILLAIATGLAAAPASAISAGWAYYRRHNYTPPAQLGPLPALTFRIWVGWVRGSNTLVVLRHQAAPTLFPRYTYLDEIREYGQVVAGLAMGFILLGGLVAFICLLVSLLWMCVGRSTTSKPTSPGMSIALLIFGFLNMAWACACYIVLAVGANIRSQTQLNERMICWPDWAFYLAFFSGVFMWIAAFLAMSAKRRAKHANQYADAPMTQNMAYKQNGNVPTKPNVQNGNFATNPNVQAV